MKPYVTILTLIALASSSMPAAERISVKADPELSKQIAAAAKAAQSEGNYSAALREYRRWLEVVPNEPAARATIFKLMSAAAEEAGEAAQARDYAEVARNLDPSLDKRIAGQAAGPATRGGAEKLMMIMGTALTTMNTIQQYRAQARQQQQMQQQMQQPQGGYGYPGAPAGSPGYQPPPNNMYAPAPGYGPAPGAVSYAPGYGDPQSGYGQPQPGYPQQQPGYPQQQPGYPQQQPQPGYPQAQPQPGYPQAQPGYPQQQQVQPGYPQQQPQPGYPQQQAQPGYPQQQPQPGYPQQMPVAQGPPGYGGMMPFVRPVDQYAAAPQGMPAYVTRGANDKPMRVVYDTSRFGDPAYFENGCGALLSTSGTNLAFTPGCGMAPRVIPASEITELRMNTLIGRDVGAFHILTRKGLCLHLAPESAKSEDAREMISALRSALKIGE
ncbi:MAG: hypothetical protein HYZ37_13845 [Candidatus Solibacter usitatus]|nr:hypothetical protein [Candidatus Solibacter usitatus]